MSRRGNYPMKNYLNKVIRGNAVRAQATIEFGIALILVVLFLFLSANLFVWLNRNVVQRQVAYENTRVVAGDGRDQTKTIFSLGPIEIKITTKRAEPGKLDFYPTEKMQKLNVFLPGGYGNETYK